MRRETEERGQELKCHKIFLHFFHESNSSGLLINMLKWFLLKIRFHGDNGEISNCTATQANTVRSQTKMNIYEKHTDFSKKLRKSKVG